MENQDYGGRKRRRAAILVLSVLFVITIAFMIPSPITDEPEFYDKDAYNIVGRFTVAGTILDYTEITTVAAEYLRDKTSDGGYVAPFTTVKIGNFSFSFEGVLNITASLVGAVEKQSYITYLVTVVFPAGSFNNVILNCVGLYNVEGVCLLYTAFTPIRFQDVDSLQVVVDVHVGKVVKDNGGPD
jgi:hypothetical protein